MANTGILDGPLHEDERILEDSYPVYAGYVYVADGRVVMSDIQGCVAQLKHGLRATEIRNCNMGSRNLWGHRFPVNLTK